MGCIIGLYCYGMRYYAPWLARWINPDPAGTVDGLNLYQFVKGNPVKHIDNGGTAIKEVTEIVRSMAPIRIDNERLTNVQYTTGVEKVEINKNNSSRKQGDFIKRNDSPDPELVDNRMVSQNTIFILGEHNKVKGIRASFTTKSGLYVKDKKSNYYHFPSSLRSTMHSDILQGRANQHVNQNDNIVAVNFKAGTGNSFAELRDNQITQPGSRGGLFQRDAEAAALEIIEEKKLVEDSGENQLLFLNINQSSCDDCSAALRAFAGKYPNLKFSFSFGGKYANNNRNSKFPSFLQDYKSRVFSPLSGGGNSVSAFDQSVFSGKDQQVYEKTDKKARPKLNRFEKENRKNNPRRYK